MQEAQKVKIDEANKHRSRISRLSNPAEFTEERFAAKTHTTYMEAVLKSKAMEAEAAGEEIAKQIKSERDTLYNLDSRCAKIRQEILCIEFTLKDYRKQLAEAESYYQRQCKQRKQAEEALHILRNDKNRTLDEEYAMSICDMCTEENYQTPGLSSLFKKGRSEIEQAFQDPNWRVIRLGRSGGPNAIGHWYAYVRNSDGVTVDMINDRSVTKGIKISTLIDEFSNPEAWNKKQMYLY